MQLETFRLLRLYVFLRTNQLALYFFDFAFVLIFYFRYAVVNLLSYSSMFATAFIYCFWAQSAIFMPHKSPRSLRCVVGSRRTTNQNGLCEVARYRPRSLRCVVGSRRTTNQNGLCEVARYRPRSLRCVVGSSGLDTTNELAYVRSHLSPPQLYVAWWAHAELPTKMAYVRSRVIALATLRCVVGSSGLEPPTSRLSGVCSNQLSYEPILVEVSGFEPLTPCLQGRCSTS